MRLGTTPTPLNNDDRITQHPHPISDVIDEDKHQGLIVTKNSTYMTTTGRPSTLPHAVYHSCLLFAMSEKSNLRYMFAFEKILSLIYGVIASYMELIGHAWVLNLVPGSVNVYNFCIISEKLISIFQTDDASIDLWVRATAVRGTYESVKRYY